MINYDLLSLVEKVLGKGKKTSGNDYAFFSPFKSHYKPKLEIDFSINNNGVNLWHCWISNQKGRSIITLFKKIKADRTYFDELYKILNTKKLSHYYQNTEKIEKKLELPKEFVKLCNYPTLKDISLKMQMSQALNYLKIRNVNRIDILRYGIGYCPNGKYSGRIIVPSYNENGILNFFVGRSIFNEDGLKYKAPNISGDIIGFESLINWKEPVTLVEGVFDAIAARYNAIPLFGKSISNALREKLLIRKPPLINIALDNDAKQDCLKLASYLIAQGLDVSMVNLNKKDVSELGFQQFNITKKNSTKTDIYDIIKYKAYYA